MTELAGNHLIAGHWVTGDAVRSDGVLLSVLSEGKSGRMLVNGFPTGVGMAAATLDGGRFAASANFGATSVGTLGSRRFLRPVCCQTMPDALLPQDLNDMGGV